MLLFTSDGRFGSPNGQGRTTSHCCSTVPRLTDIRCACCSRLIRRAEDCDKVIPRDVTIPSPGRSCRQTVFSHFLRRLEGSHYRWIHGSRSWPAWGLLGVGCQSCISGHLFCYLDVHQTGRTHWFRESESFGSLPTCGQGSNLGID